MLPRVLPFVILAQGVLSGELEVGRAVQAAGAFTAVLAADAPGRGLIVTLDAAPQQGAPAPSGTARQRRLFPPQDLGLLAAPDRDDWNKPDLIMDLLGIADGAVVADLGAGGGWFTTRLARRVGPNGLVLAQDIQEQMIEAINRRVQQDGLTNVRTVLGTPTDPKLPSGIDVVLNRKDGCARFELPEDRMGDIVVVSGGPKGSKVIGTSRDKHDLSGLNEPLRSHGGLTEQEVPVIANRKFKDAPAMLRNFDAFALGCNNIVEA